MKLALDYDGTYTAEPALWDRFIADVKAFGQPHGHAGESRARPGAWLQRDLHEPDCERLLLPQASRLHVRRLV